MTFEYCVPNNIFVEPKSNFHLNTHPQPQERKRVTMSQTDILMTPNIYVITWYILGLTRYNCDKTLQEIPILEVHSIIE
jgi:hypothetical protein